jgi:hypothetical protein
MIIENISSDNFHPFFAASSRAGFAKGETKIPAGDLERGLVSHPDLLRSSC